MEQPQPQPQSRIIRFLLVIVLMMFFIIFVFPIILGLVIFFTKTFSPDDYQRIESQAKSYVNAAENKGWAWWLLIPPPTNPPIIASEPKKDPIPPPIPEQVNLNIPSNSENSTEDDAYVIDPNKLISPELANLGYKVSDMSIDLN